MQMPTCAWAGHHPAEHMKSQGQGSDPSDLPQPAQRCTHAWRDLDSCQRGQGEQGEPGPGEGWHGSPGWGPAPGTGGEASEQLSPAEAPGCSRVSLQQPQPKAWPSSTGQFVCETGRGSGWVKTPQLLRKQVLHPKKAK